MATAAIGLVVALATTTVHSFYPGTGSGRFGPPERTAVAEVGSCRRLGPVSVDGFGYWWQCEVTVRVEDDRVVTAVVDRSVVSPVDRGRKIPFREACRGGGVTDCSYGRPVARGWKAVMGAFKLVEGMVLALIVFAIVVFLISAVFGRRGRLALARWGERGRPPPPRH